MGVVGGCVAYNGYVVSGGDGVSGLAGLAAIAGGGALLATSGHTLVTGASSEPDESAVWLTAFAALLSVAGTVLSVLG